MKFWLVPFLGVACCLASVKGIDADVIIDDFTQGTSFDTTYSSAFINSQSGLDTQHLLNGERSVGFPTIFGAGASARAALDTSNASLTLDEIHGSAGGGGLKITYGEYSGVGTPLHFNLTALADLRVEVEIQFLLAGDSKGPQPGVTWGINLHSRDSSEHFTNVALFIANSPDPFVASVPVSSLLGGPANANDVLGMWFSFIPMGDGGGIVINRLAIVPEPGTLVLGCIGIACVFLGRRRQRTI